MFGLPGLSTYIVIGAVQGGYHLVNQYTYSDYDFSLDYIRYQYYVATADTTWKIWSGAGTGEYRYLLWEEVYRDGTKLNRTLASTSSDSSGTGPKYELGALPTPRTSLGAFRFTGEPADVLAPSSGTSPDYSSRSTFLRRKPDSASLDPGRGVEYYSEFSAAGIHTARSLSYLIEKQGRNKNGDFVNTTTQAAINRSSSGLAFLDSRAISLTESGNGFSSWQTRIVDTLVDPTPSGGFHYESIDALWYVAPNQISFDSTYSSAAQIFITQLNPQATGGFSGFLYQNWNGSAYSKYQISIVNRQLTQTFLESSLSPGITPRSLESRSMSQTTVDLTQLPRLTLDSLPGAQGSFDGNYSNHEFWGSYELNGKKAYVEVDPQGVYVDSGVSTRYYTFKELQ